MFYPDLSSYEYAHSVDGCRESLNVGWLAAGEPFAVGVVPDEFLTRLSKLAARPVNLMRGWHACDFCVAEFQEAPEVDPDGRVLHKTLKELAALGNGEIMVGDDTGTCYHAPAMIVHYVGLHGYRPPDVFIECVMRGS